jgi:hypothetical protein
LCKENCRAAGSQVMQPFDAAWIRRPTASLSVRSRGCNHE